ncbi:hypothetical protein BUZ22_01010 [Staphylococcus haemolyticus]|uniref:hypothetical protein n=1 Tax=Staphylococcus TaxID=1279 RepID=UPI000D1EA96F|nr:MULTISPECIES: hypothetical protein [Staphylococcus]MCE5036292.1 hypothetical protein [Staphylococcus haemolyticus]PTK59552.1 hypothetical protein BUZ36_10785 [Staphylococcus haemolyticus]PTK76829.1 hypothetical protein BUZ24_02510 [Staphylococcus haemolyticus]PTK83927.1 hypothetical protein BUZ20_11075 [Staphylococcus haemolyticus]PTK94722.1 hypothetical protein BUZ19_11255 [Staphylococcus haemolyticus]
MGNVNIVSFGQNLNKIFNDTKMYLENIKKLSSRNIKDENIKSNLDKMGETVEEAIDKVNEQISDLKENLEWSKLTIGFLVKQMLVKVLLLKL